MPKTAQRDAFLDYLRTIAMIEVLIVHVVYWGDFLDERFEVIQSFLVFEMPLFFFVAGATSTMKPIPSWQKYVTTRWRKILIPYSIFAIITITTSFLFCHAYHLPQEWSVPKLILSWFILNGHQLCYIEYVPYSTWFLMFYLIIILFIPFLQKAKTTKPLITGLILFIGVITGDFLKLDKIQNTLTYTLWVYLGMFHKEIRTALCETKHRKHAIGLITGLATILLILFMYGISLNMQDNKFPPNTIFFIYGIIMVTCILLQEKTINRFFNWIRRYRIGRTIITCYGQHSLIVCFYHAYIFNFTIPFARNIIPIHNAADEVLKCMICFTLSFVGATILACMFQWTNKLAISRK